MKRSPISLRSYTTRRLSNVWWIIGIAVFLICVLVTNEVWLLKHYPINIFGGVNYDYAVFAYIFFGYGIIRKEYAKWDTPPTGWVKMYGRVYRKVK
jgi:membrane protein YdbS with pleckstrin-like domain